MTEPQDKARLDLIQQIQSFLPTITQLDQAAHVLMDTYQKKGELEGKIKQVKREIGSQDARLERARKPPVKLFIQAGLLACGVLTFFIMLLPSLLFVPIILIVLAILFAWKKYRGLIDGLTTKLSELNNQLTNLQTQYQQADEPIQQAENNYAAVVQSPEMAAVLDIIPRDVMFDSRGVPNVRVAHMMIDALTSKRAYTRNEALSRVEDLLHREVTMQKMAENERKLAQAQREMDRASRMAEQAAHRAASAAAAAAEARRRAASAESAASDADRRSRVTDARTGGWGF